MIIIRKIVLNGIVSKANYVFPIYYPLARLILQVTLFAAYM